MNTVDGPTNPMCLKDKAQRRYIELRSPPTALSTRKNCGKQAMSNAVSLFGILGVILRDEDRGNAKCLHHKLQDWH